MNHNVESEFDRRLERVRCELPARGLDALLVFSQKRSHVRYLSGYNPNYHTNAALVLVPLRHDPILWIKFSFDLTRAKSASWIKDVRTAPYESNAGLVTACAGILPELHLEKSRIGVVASDLAMDELSTSLDQSLRNQMPGVSFEHASDLLNEIRAVKSPVEIEAMRRSARLACEVANALGKAIRPGISDHEAVCIAERAARLQGARCDIILSTDPCRLAYPPHNSTFHDRSSVSCEITVELDGYWVQICRTFSVGKPSQIQKELFSVSQKAYRAGMTAARPGNTVGRVWSTIWNSLSQDGYVKYVEYGFGHGVGLDLPEIHPLEKDCPSEIPNNMVLVIHPAIWVPNRGAAWTGGPILTCDSPLQLDTPQEEIIEV
jgi:Xaa-Pro dipeptidase